MEKCLSVHSVGFFFKKKTAENSMPICYNSVKSKFSKSWVNNIFK